MKLVTNNTPGCVIAERIRAIAEQAISSGAVTFFASWEGQNDFTYLSAPDASTVLVGHTMRHVKEILDDEGAES